MRLLLAALACLWSSAAGAVPLATAESHRVSAGDTIAIVLPLDSGLKAWTLVRSDPAIVEVRAQEVTGQTFRLTVAGVASGEAQLVLRLAFAVPPESVLEERTVRIRVTGGLPAVRDVPDTTAAAADDAPDTALARLRQLLRERYGISGSAAETTPAAAPAAAAVAPAVAAETAPAGPRPQPPRAARRPRYVSAAGAAGGEPRRERLTTVEGWLRIAEELFRAQFYDRAQAEYERALAFDLPAEPAARARSGLAECRYRQGNRTDAITRYREVVEQYAGTLWQPRARLRLGQLQMEEENYPEAIKEFLYLRAEAPGSMLARDGSFHLAQSYGKLLRHDEALAEYERAAAVETRADQRARIWYELARLYDYVPVLRDYYRALEYYRRVTTGEYATAATARAHVIREEYL